MLCEPYGPAHMDDRAALLVRVDDVHAAFAFLKHQHIVASIPNDYPRVPFTRHRYHLPNHPNQELESSPRMRGTLIDAPVTRSSAVRRATIEMNRHNVDRVLIITNGWIIDDLKK